MTPCTEYYRRRQQQPHHSGCAVVLASHSNLGCYHWRCLRPVTRAMGRGKHVEKVLSRMPEPSGTQAVVCVTGTPGGNLLQVEDADKRTFLCRVPAKFRNKVWVLKGACAHRVLTHTTTRALRARRAHLSNARLLNQAPCPWWTHRRLPHR